MRAADLVGSVAHRGGFGPAAPAQGDDGSRRYRLSVPTDQLKGSSDQVRPLFVGDDLRVGALPR